MFSMFHASGTVMAVQSKTSSKGGNGTILLIKVGEYNGNPEMLEVGFWGKSAPMANNVTQGDEVSVGGYLRCQQSQQGYWNPRISANSLVILRKAQGGYPQSDQGYQQQQNAYADAYSNTDLPWE